MATRHHRFDIRQTMRNTTFEVFRYKDAYPKEVALHHHDFYESALCQPCKDIPRFYSYLPEEAGFGNMTDLTGALLASVQLLPFHSK